jgi:hypothetical protein
MTSLDCGIWICFLNAKDMPLVCAKLVCTLSVVSLSVVCVEWETNSNVDNVL